MELSLNNKLLKLLAVVFGVIIGMLLFTTSFKVAIAIPILILILFKVEIGIYALVFVTPLAPLKYTMLLGGYVVFSFLVKLITHKEFRFKKIPFKYSFICFIIPLIFSTLSSFTLKNSLEQFAVYLLGTIIVFLCVNLIEDKRQLNHLILAMIISSLVVSFIGLYQYKMGVNIQDSWVDKSLNPDLKTRVFSTLENPNILAEYLVMAIPLSLALIWGTRNKTNKLTFVFIIGIQALCLLLTLSRGGWLGIAFAMVLFAVFVDKRLLILYGFLGLILVLTSPDVILTRIGTIGNVEDSSTAYRFPLWMAGIDMVKDFFITGVGLGSSAFKSVYINYMRQGIVAVHTHNTFLQFFVENGVFGLITFLIVVINTIRSSLITFTKGSDAKIKFISIAVISSIGGVLLHGLADYIFFSPKIILTFWTIIAIGIVSYKLECDSLQ